jgi:hypothetical protein
MDRSHSAEANKVDWRKILKDNAFSHDELKLVSPQTLLSSFNPLPGRAVQKKIDFFF